MTFHLRTFAALSELLGNSELTVDCAPDVQSLKDELERLFPALSSTGYAVAVDLRIVTPQTPLLPGSHIALLPPFSGG